MTASPETMRQVWITRHGPPEVLEVREAAVPEPGDNEVLIKVAAAGVNFADIMARLGLYPRCAEAAVRRGIRGGRRGYRARTIRGGLCGGE
jgi:D-arabinose 1-dehydrogenase-like Zn-dependent alcohol dehydrogenase